MAKRHVSHPFTLLILLVLLLTCGSAASSGSSLDPSDTRNESECAGDIPTSPGNENACLETATPLPEAAAFDVTAFGSASLWGHESNATLAPSSATPRPEDATSTAPAGAVWAVVGFGSRSLVPDFQGYLNEFMSRGYPAAIATFEPQISWFKTREEEAHEGGGGDREGVYPLSLGPFPPNLDPSTLVVGNANAPLGELFMMSMLLKLMLPLYKAEYAALDALLRQHEEQGRLPAYMLCTAMGDACMELAPKYGVPYAVWAPALGLKGWEAQSNLVPTISDLAYSYPPSFPSRFYRTFIHPLRLLLTVLPSLRVMLQEKARMGVPSKGFTPSALLEDRPVLVSAVMGLEMARPLRYNTFVVGPSRNAAQTPSLEQLQAQGDASAARILHWLTASQSHLDSHSEPAKPMLYVAFGSIFAPSPETQAVLVSALPELLSLTRVLWASKSLSVQHIKEQLKGLFTPAMERDLLVLPWAPQESLLQHSTVRMFLTHAGAGSLAESWSAGVPTVCLPISAEQGGNAVRARALGVSVALDKLSFTVAELMASVKGVTLGFEALNQQERQLWRVKLLPSYVPRDVPERVAAQLQMPPASGDTSPKDSFSTVRTFLSQLPARVQYAANLVRAQAQGSARRAVDVMEMDMRVGISHLRHPMIEQYSQVHPFQRWLISTNFDVTLAAAASAAIMVVLMLKIATLRYLNRAKLVFAAKGE